MRRDRPSRVILRLALLGPLVWLGAAPSAAAAATQAMAKPTAAPTHHAKRHVVRRGHGYGYGFLPGYRPPEQVEWDDAIDRWRRWPGYWYGWPRWYRGRWNGGGFGPCWTQTPIGNVWNCGR